MILHEVEAQVRAQVGPKSAENVFHLQTSYGGSTNIYYTEVLFCIEFELHGLQPYGSALCQ